MTRNGGGGGSLYRSSHSPPPLPPKTPGKPPAAPPPLVGVEGTYGQADWFSNPLFEQAKAAAKRMAQPAGW
jgi:hypothetical protein